MASVRLNLTIPEEIDSVISDVAKGSGQTKAAVILSALRDYLPHWKRWARDVGVPSEPSVLVSKAGRNDPCPCGSGRKFKHCCGGSNAR